MRIRNTVVNRERVNTVTLSEKLKLPSQNVRFPPIQVPFAELRAWTRFFFFGCQKR